jgi:thymidylate kinase
MVKRIIIEGADQQGKTTLRDELANALGWCTTHYSKPFEGFDFVTDYLLPENTISDRNFLSEVVYSKVNGKPSRAQASLMCNLFSRDKTLLILMDREEDFVFDTERLEDYSLENIEKARNLYRVEFDKLNINKIKLNPNSSEYENQVQSIIDSINDNL